MMKIQGTNSRIPMTGKGVPLDRKIKGISFYAIIGALISVAFCAFLVSATIIDRSKINRIRMEQQILERTFRISDSIARLLYKTQSLAALVQYDGADNFDIIAPTLVDSPVIRNVLIAPDGIVTKVHPLAGNESILGFNFFVESAGNKEAQLAKELGELVLGGPMEVIQGGQSIFGRLPVFLDTPTGEKEFWGLVSVSLYFPQVLENAELEIFSSFGYAYELWRINPDTNEPQVLAHSYERQKPYYEYIERPIIIHNAEWFLRIFPVRPWYMYPENLVIILAGLCFSLIVFFVMQNNYQLKTMQTIFEVMAITDPLTGIFNRRHFLEIVRINIEKARRHKENCYFIMFDIDRFKTVNDTYGHQIGDKVLMEVTARIKADIRPYDLFARYGGEEFIIFTTGISKTEVCDMTERLRLSICNRKFEYDNASFESSASFGIAHMYDYNLDKGIAKSDEALYAAKRNGRNCVVFFGEGD